MTPSAGPVVEDVVFGNTVDGLFRRALGSRMTPACRQRLKAEGLDLSKEPDPGYPRVTFFRWIDITAQELFPGLSREEALEQVGRQFIVGFSATMSGKAAYGFARLVGIKAMLRRFEQNRRSSNNYLQTRFEDLGPGQGTMWVNQTSGVPTYFRGIFLQMVQALGGKDVVCESQTVEGTGCTYRLRWTE